MPAFGSSLPLPLLAAGESNAALTVFLVYTLAVFGIAALSNYVFKDKSFLSEYFLGSRSLGVWAFALTFAATSASGGSFTGFPARIYSHGWILALWISSYMVYPLCTMGILGKRINQVARISGAITVPDVLRDRFRSPAIGLLAVSLIVFFMSFNLVAQFKAGSTILIVLLRDNATFQSGVAWTRGVLPGLGVPGVDPAYLLCLVLFAVAVIAYTTYGGFHAVVWTDVMQGVVMVIGVMIMLPLAIMQVGGVGEMGRKLSEMTPPKMGFLEVEVANSFPERIQIPARWMTLPGEGDLPRLFKLNADLTIPAATPGYRQQFKYVEVTTPGEIERQLERLRSPRELEFFRQSVAAHFPEERHDTPEIALLNEIDGLDLMATPVLERDYLHGAAQVGAYTSGPGPVGPKLGATADATLETESKLTDAQRLEQAAGFLPLSIAISYFFMWAISGTGQPSNMVRLMAFNNAPTLRKSIFTVMIYFSLIYFPLVVIFCCARVLLPGMEHNPDGIMPAMAVELTSNAGYAWLAGLLIAAPFAAIMSTVDSFLLLISSAVVRDIYQRNINPKAEEKTIKRLSYLCTLLVGVGAMLGAVNPPKFLQDIIVYTGSGLAASFLAPAIFTLYWPRVNRSGMLGGMLAGFAAHLAMYVGGIFANGTFFEPWQPLALDPIVIGLAVSFLSTIGITLMTPPPEQDLIDKYFRRPVPVDPSTTA